MLAHDLKCVESLHVKTKYIYTTLPWGFTSHNFTMHTPQPHHDLYWKAKKSKQNLSPKLFSLISNFCFQYD